MPAKYCRTNSEHKLLLAGRRAPKGGADALARRPPLDDLKVVTTHLRGERVVITLSADEVRYGKRQEQMSRYDWLASAFSS